MPTGVSRHRSAERARVQATHFANNFQVPDILLSPLMSSHHSPWRFRSLLGRLSTSPASTISCHSGSGLTGDPVSWTEANGELWERDGLAVLPDK